MFCPDCGIELQNNMKFCPDCGVPLAKSQKKNKRNPAASKMMQRGTKISDNIFLCNDGKYRWIYEMPILRNPTIFILVWKIFFFIILGIFVFLFIADAFNGNLDNELIIENLKFFAYFIIGMTLIVGLSMLIYAAIMGGKYIVMFEMDENSINHKQLPNQAKKAKAITDITVIAGIATGNLSTVGIGMNAARTEMSSDFATVRKVRCYPHRDLIKLDEPFCHNQVYAEKTDYEFVRNYIFEQCKNAKVKK